MKPWISLLRETLAAAMIFACLRYELNENWLWIIVYAVIYLDLSKRMAGMPDREGWVIFFTAKFTNYLMLFAVVWGIFLIINIRSAAFGWALAAITIYGIVKGDRKPKEQQGLKLPA